MGRSAGCIPAADWSAMPKGKPLSLRGTVQDITERKQADAALRENRDLMRVFIEHAPVALAMLDREMRYLAVSPRWRRIHDLQDRELIGHSHYEFFSEVSDEWKAQHRRALAGEAIPSGEVNMARADGSLQWLRREIQPWFTADGAVGGIIIFSEDVTRRRQAEEELRRHKELLQLFVEHAPVALAMFDLDMRYIAASKLWAQDHSIDLEKIIGRSHYEVNPDVPERWKETHRRGLAGETQSVEEDRYDRADGSIEWIRWQIMPWRTAEGSAGGIVMFYEDITERKMAEAEVRESKELLQLFIDRAPAALAMFDREMRYLAVSRRWLEEYSLVGQNVLGRSHYEIVPDIPERWKEAHRRGLAGETLKSEEDRFQRADGTVQWIEWEVVPWRAADGSVGGIVLFADDITARKQAEERLRLAASVFTGAREGITITDLKGTILDVNDAFTRITGYTRKEAVGQRGERHSALSFEHRVREHRLVHAVHRGGDLPLRLRLHAHFVRLHTLRARAGYAVAGRWGFDRHATDASLARYARNRRPHRGGPRHGCRVVDGVRRPRAAAAPARERPGELQPERDRRRRGGLRRGGCVGECVEQRRRFRGRRLRRLWRLGRRAGDGCWRRRARRGGRGDACIRRGGRSRRRRCLRGGVRGRRRLDRKHGTRCRTW